MPYTLRMIVHLIVRTLREGCSHFIGEETGPEKLSICSRSQLVRSEAEIKTEVVRLLGLPSHKKFRRKETELNSSLCKKENKAAYLCDVSPEF